MMRYHNDPELGALHFELEGVFDMQEYRDLLAKVDSDGHDREHINFLWDVTQMDARHLSSTNILGIAELNQKGLNAHRSGWKSALVVGSDLSYGLARMLEAFINPPPPSELRVFRNLPEARDWLQANRRGGGQGPLV